MMVLRAIDDVAISPGMSSVIGWILAVLVPAATAGFAFFRWRDARHFRDIDTNLEFVKLSLANCERGRQASRERIIALEERVITMVESKLALSEEVASLRERVRNLTERLGTYETPHTDPPPREA